MTSPVAGTRAASNSQPKVPEALVRVALEAHFGHAVPDKMFAVLRPEWDRSVAAVLAALPEHGWISPQVAEILAGPHVPVVARLASGEWGVHCNGCSIAAQDYVPRCLVHPDAEWPATLVLADAPASTLIDSELRAAGLEYPLGNLGVRDLADQRDGQRERAEQAEAEIEQLRSRFRALAECRTGQVHGPGWSWSGAIHAVLDDLNGDHHPCQGCGAAVPGAEAEVLCQRCALLQAHEAARGQRIELEQLRAAVAQAISQLRQGGVLSLDALPELEAALPCLGQEVSE